MDLAGSFGHLSRALRHKADKPSLMQTGLCLCDLGIVIRMRAGQPDGTNKLAIEWCHPPRLFERAPVLEVG
jgi:hypothetical protein